MLFCHKMKKWFVFLIACSFGELLYAQKVLSGRITDSKSNEPIPGATVYIPELKAGTFSDKNGIYKIDNLPSAKIIIQFSFLGYKSVVEQVDLASTSSLDIRMEEAITEINEVVVTGTMRTTEITRSPVPVVTLGRKELEQNLKTNIIDAISRLPGVSAVTTGPNVSKPFIHGLGFNRVLTLYDGIRQEGQQWGDEHGVEVDENAVDHIEIIKGPASLTYGADALAGVVNLLPAPPVPDSTVKGSVITDYQTNNGLAAISGNMAGNKNGVVWGAILSHKQATNYRNKYDGRVYGTAFNESDLSAYAGVNRKWGYSEFHFSVYNDLQEIPDGSRDSVTRKFTKQITEADTVRQIVPDNELNSYKIDVLHQLVRHYRFYWSSNLILGKSKIGLLLGWQQNIRKEFSHPQSPDIPGLSLSLKTLNYDIKYSIPESKGWETILGINGMYQQNRNDGTEFIIPDYNELDIGPFVLVTKTYDKFNLSGGIRFDTRIFKNYAMYTKTDPANGFDMQVSNADTAGASNPFTGFSHNYTGISASFGFSYNFTKRLLIKSNIARGFRAPNIAEISANGIHPGSLIYQIGNHDFKPEYSLQEDLGISYRWDHISGNIDIFNNNISNYIFNEKLLNHNGQDSVIIAGNQTFKYQQSKAEIFGFEVSLDIHPYDWLHFENAVSAVYANNKGGKGIIIDESSQYLPFIPPLHTSSELRANIVRDDRIIRAFYIKAGLDFFAGQNRIYSAGNTETPTPGYALYSGGIGAEIRNRKGVQVLTIDISANNIFNRPYQSHMSRLKYFEDYPGNGTGRNGIYDEGRNISFRLVVPLVLSKSNLKTDN
jgi:iron complex outermembrane recepter protein